ncbi:WRAP53 [Mytilus coruscus]|uniref:WD repeat-containing protein 79 n=1 Tax=Mytilus coruscus TaxID=42192 RepID=A0A6J8DX19_MYTCO|nr:WRAP53 [Mytilus coruscus]
MMMMDESANTQDLLQEMDDITGNGSHVSFTEMDNTQQIVNNIDEVIAQQASENTFKTNEIPHNVTSYQRTGNNSSQPTCQQTQDFLENMSEKIDVIQNVEIQSLNPNKSLQCNTQEQDPNFSLIISQSQNLEHLSDSNMSKESSVLNDIPVQSNKDINTGDGETGNCEPPSKKLKPEQKDEQTKPVFQFVPRNVTHNKNSSSVKTNLMLVSKKQIDPQCVSKTFDSGQTCSSQQISKGDNSKEPMYLQDEYRHSQERDKSCQADSDTTSFLDKSYDANVMLPADIVKTWRTPREIQEGEIVEIERNSDSLFTSQPTCFARIIDDFKKTEDNYLRGCKWSPDGKCLLTNSNDNKLRVYHYPTANTQSELKSSVTVKETDTVYDFCWNRKMSLEDPDTCCFLTTCRDGPVHMWDMASGHLKCTYRPYNHLDEIATAHSLALSLDGGKLYTGFNRMIRVFDVSRPGRHCIQRPTFVKHQGQPGIISCIAASPQGGGIYAAGSYARAIALYHEPEGNMVCMFQGQQGGVTHIAFSPDGTKLYSGGRKDPEILCWDLRKPGQILFVALRLCETNQRLYFDQDIVGRHLFSGCHDGTVCMWDTTQPPVKVLDDVGRHLFSGCHDGTVCMWDTTQPPVKVLDESDPLLKPIIKYKAHGDCVNGVSLNPYENVLATCSGQRHYPDLGDSDDNDSIESDVIDNSVKLWKFKS